MSNDKNIARIYTRIPDELDRKFGLACASQRLSRPKGFAKAIEMWVAAMAEEAEHGSRSEDAFRKVKAAAGKIRGIR